MTQLIFLLTILFFLWNSYAAYQSWQQGELVHTIVNIAFACLMLYFILT